MSVYYYFLTSVGIFPRKEKKLKKKIEVWSNTNPGGRKTKKPVVQKHRVKALDDGWNALKQKLRLSVLPAHEQNSPTQIIQKGSGRLIDRTQGLDRDRLKIID